MIFTEYTHLQDEELVTKVMNSPKASLLECELARRLGEAIDDKSELAFKLAQWNPYVRTPKPGAKYVGDA